MRYAIVLAITGCIPEPTGLEQTWPPSLGITVEAVTTGDLDGDGQPEILVYSSGDDHQAGIYAIEGHDDLALGTATPIRAFDTFVPMAFAKPMAAAQGPATDGTPLVYTSYVDKFHEVVVDTLSNQYGDNGPGFTDLPPGNALLWLRPVRFPGNVVRVVVANGSMMQHTADDGDDARLIPAPNNGTWPTAILATTYTTGSDAWTIVVATPSELWHAPITTAGEFAWSSIRSGAAWAGQTAIDLDGDGREEIVGLDLVMHALCAIDVVKLTTTCAPLGTTSPGTEISILAAHVAGSATVADLVVAQATGADTTISVIADVAFTGDTLTGTTMAMAPVSLAHGRAVVVNGGVGTPEAVLVFGTTGTVICAVGGC